MTERYSRSGTLVAIDSMTDLSAAIQAARQRHGLKQSDLAGLSGTGLRFVGELERGKGTVALNKVMAVLNVLGLRLHLGVGT